MAQSIVYQCHSIYQAFMIHNVVIVCLGFPERVEGLEVVGGAVQAVQLVPGADVGVVVEAGDQQVAAAICNRHADGAVTERKLVVEQARGLLYLRLCELRIAAEQMDSAARALRRARASGVEVEQVFE